MRFVLTTEDLKFYNSKIEQVAEPGDFQVFVGTSSAEGKAAEFTLAK